MIVRFDHVLLKKFWTGTNISWRRASSSPQSSSSFRISIFPSQKSKTPHFPTSTSAITNHSIFPCSQGNLPDADPDVTESGAALRWLDIPGAYSRPDPVDPENYVEVMISPVPPAWIYKFSQIEDGGFVPKFALRAIAVNEAGKSSPSVASEAMESIGEADALPKIDRFEMLEILKRRPVLNVKIPDLFQLAETSQRLRIGAFEYFLTLYVKEPEQWLPTVLYGERIL